MIGLRYYALLRDTQGNPHFVLAICLNDDAARARWPDAIRVEDEHGRVLVIPPQRSAA
jgi:hypothetical protein